MKQNEPKDQCLNPDISHLTHRCGSKLAVVYAAFIRYKRSIYEVKQNTCQSDFSVYFNALEEYES